MKTKYFLFAAVMPLAMASCSDEQYLDQANAVGKDDLGELIEAPLLGGGVDGEAQTRVFEKGEWFWKPEMEEINGKYTIKSVDAIGLCWTGVVNGEEYQGPQATTGDMVYTNNKFEHAGWLYKGETAPKFHCGELNNGAFHTYFSALTPQVTYGEGKWSTTKELDFGKGIFKSANATIYSGEYIVYSPYNPTFWNAPVTAIQEREMTLTVSEKGKIVPEELMSKYAFTVGYVPTIKGGDAASEFTTKMLSSGLHFKLASVDDNSKKTIKEIVLWTKGEKGIVLKQPLSAQKIKEAMQSGQLTTEVYMEREEGDAVSSMVVKLGEKGLGVSTTTVDFYVPVLPYEKALENLNILLVDDEGKTAVIDKTNYNFAVGAPSVMTLIIKDNKVYQGNIQNPKAQGEFSDVNYAYDDTSFWRAYGKAFKADSKAAEDARTVRLLDNVTLTTNHTGIADEDYYNDDPDHDGVIIDVAEGETARLILGNDNAEEISSDERGVVKAYKYCFNKTTFGVDVEAEAWGCCGGGKVNLSLTNCDTKEGTTLTMYGGTLYLGKEINFRGDVESRFEGTDEEGVNHVGEWNRIPGVYLTQKTVVNVYAGFYNEGTMKIQSKSNNSELAEDKKGNSEFNLIGGRFVNASTMKGDNTPYKASVIVEGNGNQGEDGIFNIRNSNTATATVDNYGDIYNHGNIDNDRGKFTNRANASFTDYVGSSLSGNRLVNEDETAEFICEVNSEVRYNAAIALNGIRPTTTVRFVYGEGANIGTTGSFTKEYILKPNKDNGIYVPGASGEQLVKFESAIDNSTKSNINELILRHATMTVGEEVQPVPTDIGSVTVKSGRISIAHEALTINGDYTADGALNSYFPVGIQKITGDMNLTTATDAKIGATGNVTLVGGKALNIEGNLNAINVAGGLTFQETSKVNVGGDIVITKAESTTFGKGTSVKAKNMEVKGGNKIVFDKNNVTYLGTKDVTGTGVLTNNGEINIVNAVSGSDVPAVVWCNSREGDGTYLNNSKPQYYNK